jgi:vitamin-K-epoxide reductase (warfarin-sensitive)
MSFEMSIDVNKGIHLMCFFGMGLSYYAYVVETSKEHDADYVAMCDISEHMSCSKAFMSA